MTIQVLITDPAHLVVGDPLHEWSSVDVTRRFNEPSSGQITHPAYPWVMAQLVPGNRVVLIRDGSVWCEGPLEIPTEYTWDLTDDTDPGTVTLHFTDDLAVLAGYITWADTNNTWATQPFTANWSLTNTNAETIIRTLVNDNCGPGALAARQLPDLVLGSVASVGSDTSITTRFEPLLEVCRRAAVNGGGLGFRVHTDAGQRVFDVYAPADKTATARFSKGLGNLRSVQYKQSAPTVTHALVSGNHTEADPDADPPVAESRTFVAVADAAAAAEWWRVEQHIDGSADTDAEGELTAAGSEALAEGADPVELVTTTVDTEDLRAGRDFDLGDRVTVALPTGLEVTDIVRSIHLQATPESGEYVSSLIGSPEASTASDMVRIVRELSRRLGRIAAR